MLTTAALVSVAITAIGIYIAINAVLWLLEVLVATARWIFMPRQYKNWMKSFGDARVFFSRILLKFNFAIVSPRKAVEITEQQNHVNDKKTERHNKIKEHFKDIRQKKHPKHSGSNSSVSNK